MDYNGLPFDRPGGEHSATDVLSRLVDELDQIDEQLPFGVWLCEPDGGLRHANQDFLDLLGMTMQEASGFGWVERLAPESGRSVERWKEQIRERRNWDIEHQIRDVHGTLRTLLVRGKAVRGESGLVDSWIAVYLDITHRKRAEQLVKQSRDFAETVIRTLPDPVVVLHSSHRVVAANAAFYRLFNRSRAGFDGELLHRVLGRHHDGAGLSCLLDELLRSGSPIDDYCVDVELPARGQRRLSIGGRRMLLPERDEVLILLTIRDVTDAERRLESKREIQEHHVLATLAHELRNPLSPIKNALKLMQRAEQDPERLGELRDMMLRQVDQMVRLLDDVLDVSRISRGRIALNKNPVHLQSALRTAIETARPFIDESHHHFEVDIPSEPLTVCGDAVRIAQIVINLLNNAAKYTPAGGQIGLCVKRDHDHALVRVRDNGIGIQKEKQAAVFELFFQADASRERGPAGLGIGLTLAKTFVEMHEGSISVESEGPAKGCVFTVRLPLCDASQVTMETVNDALVPQRPAAKYRVLVVEDLKTDAFLLAQLLKAMGHSVAVANNGRDALRTVKDFGPDVILSDVAMPVMNGYELAKHLRAGSDSCPLLVALTGHGQDVDRERALAAGFHGHLVKPIGISELENLLDRLFNDPLKST